MPKLKNLLVKIMRWVVDVVVDVAPYLFYNSLKKKYPEIIIRNFNTPKFFHLQGKNLPEHIHGFEDLTNLFWSTPLNRGVLRQDIDEAAALYRIVNRINPALGVEIGRYFGASTILLASAVGPKGNLISIDIDPKDDVTLKEVLLHCQLIDRVELIVEDANQVDRAEETYDFVFIDGDHSYEGARRDHNKWGSKVKKFGYIIHHDMSSSRAYATQQSDLAMLQKDILRIQHNELEIVEETGSMCIYQRIAPSWTLV